MKCLFVWLLLPIAFWISSIHCAQNSEYAYTRILILGPTGVGKSSVASVLAGCAPGDCLFPVCSSINSINSCTNNTSIAQAKFIGNFAGPDILLNAGNVTIVDTPGFGDVDLEEPKLLDEMVQVLKEDLRWTNLIVLCFDRIRLDAQINAMLGTLETLFGENLWKNTIIEVTKWAFDEKSIQDRKHRGITEEDTLLAINNQLKKNFHLNHSLPGVFLDSLAVHYPDDEVQTTFFRKYSSMLWEAARDTKPFSLHDLGQVQDGTTKACAIHIDCCDELTNEINAVKSSISDLVVTNENFNARLDHFNERLNDNTKNILDNKLAIQTNEKQIDTNTDNIDSNVNKIDTNTNNIDSNANKIDSNTHDIASNRETIDTLTKTTSRFVSYCGYQSSMGGTGTLTYSRLVTAQNSFSTGGLDIKTGVFTPPTRGTYLVTQNFRTDGTEGFEVYINKNGNDLEEGYIRSYITPVSDQAVDMTGRTITLDLQANDKLKIHVKTNDGSITFVTFCVTLLH